MAWFSRGDEGEMYASATGYRVLLAGTAQCVLERFGWRNGLDDHEMDGVSERDLYEYLERAGMEHNMELRTNQVIASIVDSTQARDE